MCASNTLPIHVRAMRDSTAALLEGVGMRGEDLRNACTTEEIHGRALRSASELALVRGVSTRILGVRNDEILRATAPVLHSALSLVEYCSRVTFAARQREAAHG